MRPTKTVYSTRFDLNTQLLIDDQRFPLTNIYIALNMCQTLFQVLMNVIHFR